VLSKRKCRIEVSSAGRNKKVVPHGADNGYLPQNYRYKNAEYCRILDPVRRGCGIMVQNHGPRKPCFHLRFTTGVFSNRCCVSLNPTVSQFFGYITGTRDRFYIATSGGNGDVVLMLEQSWPVHNQNTRNEALFVASCRKGVSLW